MKLIVAIGAFIGIFFFNSGAAQDMKILGRLHIEPGITVVKVFDLETKMVCYMAFYGAFGNTIDCLKSIGNNEDKTVLAPSSHFVDDLKVMKVFDIEESIMCYIVTGSAAVPGTPGSAETITLDCERL